MKSSTICRALILASFGCFASPAGAAEALVPDTPTQIGGITVVCTGVSLDARQDPRWNAYALKIEFAGPGGQYTGDEIVSIRRGTTELVHVSCPGPWLLLQLPAGRYQVSAEAEGQTATSAAFVPKEGQGRIILRFAGTRPSE